MVSNYEAEEALVQVERWTEDLADAMAQLLDDMGKTGVCVSLGAKIKAHLAYEPFRDLTEPEYEDWLTYDEAVALQKKYEDRHG